MAATAGLFLFSQFTIDSAEILLSERNFYGVIRVFDADLNVKRPTEPGGERVRQTFKMRYLGHGTTIHGLEILEPEEFKSKPMGYFSKVGPLGDIFSVANPKDVAIIGLGAGVMNCYNAPDRRFTYIEIDGDMAEAAKKYFSFLTDCKSASEPEIIIGDGRLELKKLGNRKFDLIMLDAISSDSIPTHLLTIEALQEYLNHLTPDGVLVFHLTNRYFYIETLFPAMAEKLGLQHRYNHNPFVDVPFLFVSKWMVLARPDRDLSGLSDEKKWITLTDKSVPYWTDDYTNIMGVVHLTPPETHTYRLKKDKK
jgi:spermidine synthase